MSESVAMTICPICNEPMDILLSRRIKDGKLKEIFPERQMLDPTRVCQGCRDKYLKEGILIIDPKTAALAVITEDCFKRIFTVPVPKERIAFMEEHLMRQIGLLGKITCTTCGETGDGERIHSCEKLPKPHCGACCPEMS